MKRLFVVEGEHGYHGVGGGGGVRFVPTLGTQKLMGRCGVTSREEGGCLGVWYDPLAHDKVKAYAEDSVEPLIFSFLVVATEAIFLNYTVLPEVPPDHLWVEKIKGTPAVVDAGVVEVSDLTQAGLCCGEDLVPPPVALVVMDYSKDWGLSMLEAASAGDFQRHTLHFEGRKTYWRYHIPCNGSPDLLAIEDRSGVVQFACDGLVSRKGFQTYARFVSDRPLALEKRGEGRFLLKGNEPGRPRTLLKVLPNAPPDPLHSMAVESRRVFVSDIFVHHYVHGR